MKPIYKQIASAVLLLVVGILGGNVAPPILPKPAPEPSPVVRVKPVSCIVTKDGKRIESQPISDIAANEADGVHEVLCIPPLGNPIVRRTITVATEGAPVPQPPRPITPVDPQPQPTTPVPAGDIKAVIYVYEKDDGMPPPAVLAALNRLNRERNIIATDIDRDVVDGNGDTPEQYKAPIAAAAEYKLPVLVLMKKSGPPSVVKAPKTEQEVWEAVK